MSKITIPYTPREWQTLASQNMNRFTVLVVHRRAGKTVFDVVQSIGYALSCPKPRAQCAYIAPFREQAKKVAWDEYKEKLENLRRKNLVEFNESELKITFKNGAKIYLMGAENPEAIRGMYFDHVVLDEYKDMPSDFFEKVIGPTLSDRKGLAIITGTPSGRDHFYDMYQRGLDPDFPDWSSLKLAYYDTNAVDADEIEAARRRSSEEAFAQEYECSFESALVGAYFGKNISRLRAEGRVRNDIQHDPLYPVIASWDIGFDGTVVWYAQKVGEQVRIIDCDMFHNKDIPHVVNKVLNKPYTYVMQLLPHDAKQRLGDKTKTKKRMIENLGLKCKVLDKASRDVGIHAARNLIDRCVFSDKCDKKQTVGRFKLSPVDSLSLYRSEYNETNGVTKPTPVHDVHSHTADSFRYMAMGLKDNLGGDMVTAHRYNRPGCTNPELLVNKWNPYRRK